jgi:hypothetical protein
MAATISLGNWMDRHTLIGLDEAGVGYRNGLRNVPLKWEDIQQVRVLPAQWGNRVQVIGEQAYFVFNTLGEVQVQGKIMGRVGFIDGEAILQRIIKSADLRAVPPPDASAPAGIYYYVRD